MGSPQRYLPLDGLRAVAIAAVFWFHYRVRVDSAGIWGWAGVDLFFALSGYLITGILYDSLGQRRYFARFYARRALRIFPLYWGLWAVLVVFVLVKHGRFDPYYLAWPAYLGNFLDLHAVVAGLGHEHYAVLPTSLDFGGKLFYFRLGPYWSLAVEEQYYLIWPLVVWLVRDRRKLLAVCLGAVAAILALRIALHASMPPAWVEDNELYFFTFTRADSLLAGAAVALWARGPQGLSRRLTGWLLAAGAVAVAGLAVSAYHGGIFIGSVFAPWLQTYGFSLVSVASAAAVVAALRVGWVARALALKPLAALGRVSYGFYVFHLLFFDFDRIAIAETRGHLPRNLIHVALFLAIWALAWLSWHFFESPILRWKGRRAAAEEIAEAVPPGDRAPQVPTPLPG